MLLRACRIAVLLACPLGLAPADLSAQPAADVPVDGWMLGPVVLQPELFISGFGVDTNILREADAPKRDVVGTAATRIGVQAGRGVVRFDATTLFGYEYYRDYVSLRAGRQDHRGRVRFVGRRASLQLGGGWFSGRERLNYEVDARVLRETSTARAGVDLEFSPRTAVSVSADHSRTMLDNTGAASSLIPAGMQDQQRDGLTTLVTYRITPYTSLTATGQVEETRFDRSPVRNARRMRTLAGLSMAPAALISGTVAAGYQWFEPDVTTLVPHAEGLTATGDLYLRLHEGTRLRVGGDRDFEYAYQAETPLYTLGTVRVGLSQALGNDWRLSALWSLQRLDYGAHALPSLPTAAPVDRGRSWAAEIAYRVSPKLQLVLDGRHLRRESTDVSRAFTAVQVLMSVRYTLGRTRARAGGES